MSRRRHHGRGRTGLGCHHHTRLGRHQAPFTTAGSVQSGLYFGYLSLVDGMIDRISAEVGGKPRVIATGGLAELFGGGSEKIETIDPLLTLKGLRLIDERNRGG